MKLTLLKEQLMTPLEMAAVAAERSSSDDVNSHVLVSSDKGNMQVTGVGPNAQISSQMQGGGEEQANTTLPAKKLLNICRTLPDTSTISVDVRGDTASLKVGRSRFKLRVFPVDSFPQHKGGKIEVSLQIPAGQLRRMLNRTAFAVAVSDVRRYLTGMLLEVHPQQQEFRTIATDGHRLAVNKCKLDAGALKNKTEDISQVIIPLTTVQHMSRLLDKLPGGEKVQLEFSATGCSLSTSAQQVQSLVIDGTFPDYERVIPEQTDKSLLMLCAPLQEALKRAAVIVENEPASIVKLHFSPGKMKVLADNHQGEEYEEEVDGEYHGEELDIAFNLNYLQDMLSTSAGPQFRMYMQDSSSSVRLEPVAPEDEEEKLTTIYVLMPMRL